MANECSDTEVPENPLTEGEREVRGWVEFAARHYPHEIVRGLLIALGDDPDREGLRNTPARVVRSWAELYAGYGCKAEDVFSPGSDRGFDSERYDQMILLRHIPFTSTCEHHLLPFSGEAAVAYIPDPETGALLGISKLARLVELHARKLQNQERITASVADDLSKLTMAQGVGVTLTASHNCMVCRGVLKPGSEMVTTALRGIFMQDGVKEEFLRSSR